MLSHVQLDFRCPRCTLAGLTPEVTVKEGLALARDELQLRCPQCGAMIDVDASSADFQFRLLAAEPTSLMGEVLQQLKNRNR